MNEFKYQIVRKWALQNMERRKGHKVHNFLFTFKIGGIFTEQIVFYCSGNDNNPNGTIFTDIFQIPSKDLTEIIRDYQISKILE